MNDYLNGIVLPSFFDDKLFRQYGEENIYFIYEPELVYLSKEDDIVGIWGTFVKDSLLQRSHTYDSQEGIREEPTSLEAATFAQFLLILNNHRLIYLPMTRDAPSLQNFQTTIKKFLNIKHDEFLRTEKHRLNEQSQRATIKGLAHIHPKPTLDVEYLVSKRALSVYLDQFQKLQSLTIRVMDTNQEAEYSDLIDDIRELSKPINPDRTQLSWANSEGLNIDHVREPVDAFAHGEKVHMTLKGQGHEGTKMQVDNEKLRLKVEHESLPAENNDLVKLMYQDYINQAANVTSSGDISIGPNPLGSLEKIDITDIHNDE
ncbi:hypothetical protein [Limimonas halophila]|nr:hypothetical protein [Limimonas halophila]